MLKAFIQGFCAFRLIAITTIMLLAPFTAFAGGFGQHDPDPPEQSAERHQSGVAMDISEHHGVPAEVPLHCHEKSPAPQAVDLNLNPFSTDQALRAEVARPPSFQATATVLKHSAVRIHIAGPPRFILFSNFRS